MIEQLAGSENVAPGDFASVSYNDTDHALTLQPGRSIGEAALHFGNEIVDGHANRARLINLFVGFRMRVAGNGGLEVAPGNPWPRCPGRCESG